MHALVEKAPLRNQPPMYEFARLVMANPGICLAQGSCVKGKIEWRGEIVVVDGRTNAEFSDWGAPPHPTPHSSFPFRGLGTGKSSLLRRVPTHTTAADFECRASRGNSSEWAYIDRSTQL